VERDQPRRREREVDGVGREYSSRGADACRRTARQGLRYHDQRGWPWVETKDRLRKAEQSPRLNRHPVPSCGPASGHEAAAEIEFTMGKPPREKPDQHRRSIGRTRSVGSFSGLSVGVVPNGSFACVALRSAAADLKDLDGQQVDTSDPASAARKEQMTEEVRIPKDPVTPPNPPGASRPTPISRTEEVQAASLRHPRGRSGCTSTSTPGRSNQYSLLRTPHREAAVYP